MAIGELMAIAEKIRELFRSNENVKPEVESIIRGEKDWVLILETWMEGRVDTGVPKLPGDLGVLQDAIATRMKIKAGLIRRGYDVTISEIARATNERGQETVVMPVEHFEKPEAIAMAIRLRTYLSNMDVE
jgi:hypothetical protein